MTRIIEERRARREQRARQQWVVAVCEQRMASLQYLEADLPALKPGLMRDCGERRSPKIVEGEIIDAEILDKP